MSRIDRAPVSTLECRATVAAFDAHGENILTGAGGVAPIDLFVVRAGEDLAAFLALPAEERAAEVGQWVSLSSD